jgi:hypothetical protein
MRGHGMTGVNDSAWRIRRRLRVGNGVTALALSAALLGVLGAGAGSVPALGRMLVPGHGAWDWRFRLLPAMTRPVGRSPVLAVAAFGVPGLAMSGPALMPALAMPRLAVPGRALGGASASVAGPLEPGP